MVFKKRKIVLTAVSFLFILSLYLGFGGTPKEMISDNSMTEETQNDQSSTNILPGEAVAVSGGSNDFSKIKNDREIVRSKATELLRSVIDDVNASSDSKKEAENAIIKMANDIDKEMKIESLLVSKGYKECAAFISDASVTITIKYDNLKNEDMAKINDIVYEITGNNTIKIVEVN